MILSKKYKEAMDKIVLSDELKTKIIENAAKNQLPAKAKSKRAKAFYLRYGISYAACFLFCFLIVSASRNFSGTDIIPPVNSTTSTLSPVPAAQETTAPEWSAADIPNGHVPVDLPAPTEAALENHTVQQSMKETEKPQNDKSVAVLPPKRSENDIPQLSESHTPDENIQPEQPENNMPPLSENQAVNENDNPEPPESNIPPLSENQTVDDYKPPGVSGGNGTDDIPADTESIFDIYEELGYAFKIPEYLPEGYELDRADLMFGSLIQISYQSENDEIVYRTEKTNADISGDYNVYDTVETEMINNIDTTLKSSDDVFYGAVWNDGDMSYSLNSTNGLDKDTIVKIVESTDYPSGQTEEVNEEITETDGDLQEQDDVSTSDQSTADVAEEIENHGPKTDPIGEAEQNQEFLETSES